MGMKHIAALAATVGLALALGACANDNLVSGATASIPEKPKADPVCTTLAQKMDDLRKDGVTQRVEQASQGKGTTVSVKRESLARLSELNRTSVEFQQKCSAFKPAPVPAAAAPAETPAKSTKTAAVAKATPKPASAAATAGIAAPGEKKE